MAAFQKASTDARIVATITAAQRHSKPTSGLTRTARSVVATVVVSFFAERTAMLTSDSCT